VCSNAETRQTSKFFVEREQRTSLRNHSKHCLWSVKAKGLERAPGCSELTDQELMDRIFEFQQEAGVPEDRPDPT
jgi:hypothetical protein